jgi:hypothetical protein
MKDLLNKVISVYNGFTDTIGQESALTDFLYDRTHNEEITEYRRTGNKQIKASLPCATISGYFSPTRKGENLVTPSGLMCIDIDRKDNLSCPRWGNMQQLLSKLDYVVWAAKSVGGEGYYIIVPVRAREQEAYTRQFKAIQADFKSVHITIDAACKDMTRLRVLSLLDKPYFNPDAQVYSKFYNEPAIYHAPANDYRLHYGGDNGTLQKVDRLCGIIQAKGIDLTQDYDDWVAIGLSLAQLGEAGRKYYHIVCENYIGRNGKKYSPEETNRKFDNYLAKRNGNITIASFFYICKQAGIE